MAYIDTGAYDRWRKAQEQAAAAEQYNAQKAALDQKYENKGLGGFLGDIVGGIGKTIGDVGKGVGGLFGTAGASFGDFVNSVKDGKATDEGTRAFKRYWYGGEDDADAAAKAAGTSLNAATTLASTVLPAAGAGTAIGKVAAGTAANTAAGALGGVADELQQQGKDASFEGAANRAISGAAAGLATGGLNRKIGNATSKVGSTLLNNKLATSAIGRGALSGAVGGSVGAGTSAALAGQDVAQAALQGGLTGAMGGAAQAGIISGARSISPRTKNQTKKYVQQKNDVLNSGLEGSKSPSSQLVNPETGLPISGSQTTTNNSSYNSKNVNPNLMYGESELGNRTKRGIAADAISRLGNTLEGAQTNVTRAAARDLGIESTGKVIDNVRRKTGLTNLETQAQLARELTGGENSLMDRVQRQALTATENGKPFLVDTTEVENSIPNIVNSITDDNVLDTKKVIQTLKRTVGNNGSDTISIANRLKSQAADLRGKGITDPPAKDKALAKIYSEVANKLDDLSYSAIPKENIEDMFGATIGEMRGRAEQAQSNGNTDIAKAYNTLADSLDKQPRTIQAFRNFKKDFVDVSKINRLTGQAENGAAIQMGQSFVGGLKRGANTILQRPVNAALAKVGGVVNNIADIVDTGGNNPTPVQSSIRNLVSSQPMSQNTSNILGNFIGRTTGLQQADNNITNLQKTQDYQNLENMFSDIVKSPSMGTDALVGGGTMYSTPQTNAMSQMTGQLNEIAGAMNNALAAGDITAYNQLANMYTTAYKIYQTQAEMAGLGNNSNMSTSEKNQLAKLESAGTALDQLEELYNKAGGGQGIIGGNIANFLGGLGLNSNVSTYNQLAQGLINQIGAAIGKTDSLNTEGEVQRALSLVPKITDDQQTAKNKLATLRSLLQTNTGTYNQLYQR